MRLATGEIVEIHPNAQKRMARVRIAGAFKSVPVMFLPDAKVGDCILIDSGVAIAKVKPQAEENRNVLGNSW
ncbi:MAG: HypC/HybG/HupF family hydrogenase formation chaperone [Bacteroidota bacterium]